MGLITVKAIASIGPTDSTGVPTEFVLLRSGVNSTEHGELVFDAEAAQSVMSVYAKRGIDLTADYEHQSLHVPPIEAPASASKWTPELRNGDLVASSIKWTPRATRMIAEGEYRYFSIACRVDAKSMRVVEVLNFGLTNLPAANGIAPLKAASLNSGQSAQEHTSMKTVLVALGLNAEIEESAAVVEASRLADLKRDVLALTNKSSLVEAIGALTAMKSAHETVVKLTAQVAQLEADRNAAEIKSLLDAADNDHKLAPAKRPELEAFAAKSGVDALRVCLSMMAPLVDAPKDAPKPAVIGDASQPSTDEYAIAKAFVGDDPVAIAKRIEEIRACNALYTKGVR